MSYFLCVIFGILPSFIWLSFYLKTDKHPESNRMILKIFLFGMLAAIPAVLLEIGFLDFLTGLDLPSFLSLFLKVFLAVAFVEEMLKYLVVKMKVFDNPELDEPIDVILYMIIAALGFAAVENILILLSLGSEFLLENVFLISVFRFWGATFLHALCSGVLGFFMVLSIFKTKKRKILFATGLITVSLLHGLYNFSIMNTEGFFCWLIPACILMLLAIILFAGFKKAKKLKSVCKAC